MHAMYVGFLKTKPSDGAREKLLGLRSHIDDLQVRDREVYWRCVKSLRESLVTGAVLEKTLGPATMRNVSTVRKLAAKVAS
jgi:uncharacterized protein (DUF1697 family)